MVSVLTVGHVPLSAVRIVPQTTTSCEGPSPPPLLPVLWHVAPLQAARHTSHTPTMESTTLPTDTANDATAASNACNTDTTTTYYLLVIPLLQLVLILPPILLLLLLLILLMVETAGSNACNTDNYQYLLLAI